MSQEAWFALVDNLAAATALSQDKKKGRAFVTFLPNENRELSFDVTEFMRHKKAEVTGMFVANGKMYIREPRMYFC